MIGGKAKIDDLTPFAMDFILVQTLRCQNNGRWFEMRIRLDL